MLRQGYRGHENSSPMKPHLLVHVMYSES